MGYVPGLTHHSPFPTAEVEQQRYKISTIFLSLSGQGHPTGGKINKFHPVAIDDFQMIR